MSRLNKPETHGEESLPLASLEGDGWPTILKLMRLSRQQAQILDLLLKGVCDEEIAPVVGIPQSALRSNIQSLLAQTGSNNRVELARYVRTLMRRRVPDKSEAIFCGKRLF
jgi:DNA-binding NarL/FixJ family response regulator